MQRIKGTIVIGTARSGSHMTCDMLYNESQFANKIMLGEVTELPDVPGKHVYCSIVQNWAKVKLAVDTSWQQDYVIVNLRRRDKVAQYLSWCVFRAQTQASISKHSPQWNDYKDLLPWASTADDIEQFLVEQYMDFAFTANQIVYYEDMAQSHKPTKFKKNQYPVQPQEIVTDLALVKNMLEKFSYDNR